MHLSLFNQVIALLSLIVVEIPSCRYQRSLNIYIFIASSSLIFSIIVLIIFLTRFYQQIERYINLPLTVSYTLVSHGNHNYLMIGIPKWMIDKSCWNYFENNGLNHFYQLFILKSRSSNICSYLCQLTVALHIQFVTLAAGKRITGRHHLVYCRHFGHL